MRLIRGLGALALWLCPLVFAETAVGQTAQYPAFRSETPEQFKPATGSFDYTKRDVMIPMRDGVKLHTVILVPKGAHHAPILLTRTPYSATAQTSRRRYSARAAKVAMHAASADNGPGAASAASVIAASSRPATVAIISATRSAFDGK